MPQRKPYNPYTKYGRKKLREQADMNYNRMSDSEKSSHDFWVFILSVLILIIGVSTCGTKWLH
jgi:hypothetical protein